jgi:hypothetical protein
MKSYKDVCKKISFDEYLKIPALGSTAIKHYARHPYHVGEIKKTNAMVIGSALHCLVLEPELFEKQFFVSEQPDKRLKAAKDEIQCCADNGVEWISSKDFEKINEMKESIFNKSKFAKKLLCDGIAESSIEFDYKGVNCKARFDYVKRIGSALFCCDLKKISPKSGVLDIDSIESYIGKFGCHIQAALYTYGLKQLLDTDEVYFVNIFVSEPSGNLESECVCSLMPEDSIEVGMSEIDLAVNNIEKYKEKINAEDFISDVQIFSGVINKGMPRIGLPKWYKL